MFLRKTPQANGRIFLAIVKGYRDPLTKTTKTKTVKSIGFLDELEKQYDDPITYLLHTDCKTNDGRRKEKTDTGIKYRQ